MEIDIEIEKITKTKVTKSINVGDCFHREIFYFKVVTDILAIKVVASEFYHNVSIETCSPLHIFRGDPVKITNGLFMQKFDEVSGIIHTLVSSKDIIKP